MSPSTQVVPPLRQRMIEDMRLRKLDGKTQIAYVRAVRRLAGFLRRSPDTATGEDLRRFQLHLVDQGTSSMTINATISGLRVDAEGMSDLLGDAYTAEPGVAALQFNDRRDERGGPIRLDSARGLDKWILCG